MSETKQELKQFQWKKGDRFGKIVTVASEDKDFYYFKDGSKIFKNAVSEFMGEVVDGKPPFPLPSNNSTIKSVDQAKKPSVVETTTKQEVQEQKSAIEELVEKLSSKNIEKFETTINLNIPTREIYKMLVSNADENPNDLIDTIAKVAVSKIEINKLQEYLTIEVTNFINNYYNE